jgi:hypothetical protein
MTIIYGMMMSVVIALFVLVFKKTMRWHEVPTPFMGWLVGISFFLILPLCILILNGGYKMPASYGVLGRWGEVDLSDSSYIYPFLVIWLSLVLTACTLLIVLPKRRRTAELVPCYAISLPKLRAVILICSVIIMTDWIASVVMVGGIRQYFFHHWYTRFDETIEKWGGIFVLFQHTTNAIQIIFTALTALYIDAAIKRHTRQYGIMIFALIIVFMNMVMTGNRIYIALLMLYAGSSLLVQRRFLVIFFIGLVLPVLVLFFSAWAHVRGGIGDISSAISNYKYSMEGESNKFMNALVDVTEASNVMLLFHIINDFGTRYDFLYGSTYTRATTFFIPRTIYPDRTKSFTVTLAELYEPEAHTSFSSTMLGEMYANFSILSAFLLPMFTLAILWASGWVMKRLHRHGLLSALLFMIFAWMSRSVFAGNFIAIIFCIVLIRGLRFEKGLFYPTNSDELLYSGIHRACKARALDRRLFSG